MECFPRNRGVSCPSVALLGMELLVTGTALCVCLLISNMQFLKLIVVAEQDMTVVAAAAFQISIFCRVHY